MEVLASVAADDPHTRRAVRLLWRWAWVRTLIGAAAVTVPAVWNAGAKVGWALPPRSYTEAVMGSVLLLGAMLFLNGIAGLARTARMSRVLHRAPWQGLPGWYHYRELSPSPTIYGPVPRRRSVLRVSHAGRQILLRIDESGRAGQPILKGLAGGEVWLAIGARRFGVAAVPPADVLFPVWRVRPGSRRERSYLKDFPLPNDR